MSTNDWMIDRVNGVVAIAAVVAIGAAACMPDIEWDESEAAPRVQPVFDSEAETIPLPNDAALDPKGTLPDLEGVDQENAEGEFLQWLSSLHGWLPETPIEIPFDGRLDPGSLDAEDVALYRRTDETFESVEVAEVNYREKTVEVSAEDGEIREIDGSVVSIVPAEDLAPREEFAAVVTKDVDGADGRAISEPQPIFFSASEEPLVDENGNPTIESLERLSPDELQQLEGLRQSLQPVFAHAADQGIERDDVAMAFRWSTVRDPMTILDPASETVPLPNTAALEDDGTFPAESALGEENVPAGGEEPGDAQEYFNAYLDRLRGWPPTTPVTLPISGEVDPETLTTDSVQLWAMSDGEQDGPRQMELESVDYDAESGSVELVPAENLSTRTEFVAFATEDVRDTEGLSLTLPAPLQMATQPHPILEDGSSTVGRISDEEAEAIEGLRQSLRPAATFVDEETDTGVDELGAIWSWYTWQDTFAVFDPTTGTIPFPHDAVRGDDGTVDLPTDGLSDLQAGLIEELNRRYGFSTVAAGWVPFDGPIDPSTLNDQSLQFMWINKSGAPEKIYDPARYRVDYREQWDQVTVETIAPWHRDPNYDPQADSASTAGIVTTDLQSADGHPVRPTPAFVFLRSPEPVFENGESTVDQLDDQTARTLESSRQQFNLLLTVAPGQLDDLSVENRDQVALAWAWHPENTPQTVQEVRAQALANLDERGETAALPADDDNLVEDPGSDYAPTDEQTPVDMANVAAIQWAAEFETVDFLDDASRVLGYMDAAPETVGISVFVPKKTGDCQRGNGAGFDVVIAQHGLGGSRIQPGMALANELAARCLAMVTMDFPLHGGRTPGTNTLHPQPTPEGSGMNFFSTDVVASKNHTLQSIVDLVVLRAMADSDEGLEATIDDDPSTNWFRDGGDREVGYVGLSLGGFAGVPFTTVEPGIRTAVFSGTGGKLARVLIEGALGESLVGALEDAGLADGTFERYRALAFLQWLADPVDPFSFSPFLTGSPLYEPTEPLRELTFEPGSGFSTASPVPANDVLLQMMQGADSSDDPVVPNATTELLAEAAGVPLEETTFTGPHSLLFVTDDESGASAAAECARGQAAAWLAEGLTGTGELSNPDSIPQNLRSSNCP